MKPCASYSQYNMVLTSAGYTEPACEYDYSYLLQLRTYFTPLKVSGIYNIISSLK